MIVPMKYSKAGLALTERFESCRLIAYQDIRGIWTIGWGHTGPEVHEGLEWTQEQCDAQADIDTRRAEDNVNKHVVLTSIDPAPALTQGEFDALVDFDYNLGDGNLESSTLLRLVNAGDMEAAAAEFEKWDHAGGKEVAGLLRRRLAEKQEFLS